METDRKPQHGQVLILVAFAMVTLLAIGALVVDLGLSWMLHRHEQNAADPAALAAARWIPKYEDTGSAVYGPSGLMREEACSVARQNGFFAGATTNAECTPSNDGDRAATMSVHYPPSPTAGSFHNNRGFVQVVIAGKHTAFFARIFGRSDATVASSAVAAHVPDSVDDAYSIRVLDDTDECGTMKVSGSGGTTKVSVDGAIHVNSTCGSPDTGGDINECHGSDSGALRTDGGGAIEAGGYIYVRGTCKGDPASITPPGQLIEDSTLLPDPYTELVPPRLAESPAGACGGVPSVPSSSGCTFGGGGSFTLEPGVYYGGWKITGPSTQLKLKPGIYIIAGGGISQSGGTIESIADPLTGNPAEVLIFSTDKPNVPSGVQYSDNCHASWTNSSNCQGELNLNGKNLLLSGITSGRLKGMLIWQDGDGSCPTANNNCEVRLGGQINMVISGTLYASTQHLMLDGGSSGTGVATVQIIVWHLTLTGGSNIDMPYDPDAVHNLRQKGLVR